jgi:hypothetical protein
MENLNCFRHPFNSKDICSAMIDAGFSETEAFHIVDVLDEVSPWSSCNCDASRTFYIMKGMEPLPHTLGVRERAVVDSTAVDCCISEIVTTCLRLEGKFPGVLSVGNVNNTIEHLVMAKEESYA